MIDATVTFSGPLQVLTWLGTTSLAALIGAAFGSYFGKKGEIQAVQEDLHKVVAQTAAITKAQETIRGQLSNQTWDRQRQWEMKRDAVLALVLSLGRARDTLMYLGGCAEKLRETGQTDWRSDSRITELALEWQRRMEDFDEKRLIASFLCSDDFGTTLTETGKEIRRAYKKVSADNSMQELFPSVREVISSTVLKARQEIGIKGF